MKMIVNGREIEVPADNDGNVEVAEVRRAANVPDNRILIEQKPIEGNFIIPRRGRINIDPYTHFIDSGTAIRGTA